MRKPGHNNCKKVYLAATANYRKKTTPKESYRNRLRYRLRVSELDLCVAVIPVRAVTKRHVLKVHNRHRGTRDVERIVYVRMNLSVKIA